MARRDAFFDLPKNQYLILDDDWHGHPKVPYDENYIVYGCGRKDCDDCEIRRQLVLDRGGRFVKIRSSGAKERYGPGTKLAISDRLGPNSINERNALDPDFCKMALCQNCSQFDFARLVLGAPAQITLSSTYEEVVQSSKGCPLCAMIASAPIEPWSFRPDPERPITLEAAQFSDVIRVRFPSKEQGYEDWDSERYFDLHLFATLDSSNIAPSVKRRLPRSPDDSKVAQQWLAECLRSHNKCRAYSKSAIQSQRPSRLINVGALDDITDPHLEEGPLDGEYLTLSYCWGPPSTVTQTTTETLSQYKNGISFGSLSRIFQDAIHFTRLLGVKYIWIDALCVIQDSSEDKTIELPRMANIYAASLLTISASSATSGDSTLFEPRQLYDLIQLPITNSQEGDAQFYITDQVLRDFADDVPKGSLGSRGWCFQERLVATRLLHFGKDQFHWECHEGLWSESSTERRWYDDLTTNDDCRLRENLSSEILFQDIGIRLFTPLGENPTEETNVQWEKYLSEFDNLKLDEKSLADQKRDAARRRPQYNAWYIAVSAYTSRDLSYTGDKLPALAGAAARFGNFVKDFYAAGLWVADMVPGLLWSRRAFENVKVDTNVAIRSGPGGRGDERRTAPSWSWASVDGPVHWVRYKDGAVLLGKYGFMSTAKGPDTYLEPKWAALRVQGQVLELEQLSLLRDDASQPELQTEFEKQLAKLPTGYQPQIDFDDPGHEKMLLEMGRTRPLYFLLVSVIPYHSNLEGNGKNKAGTSLPLHQLGHSLVLRYWPSEDACRRVGIAQVALRDFAEAQLQEVHIL